MGFTDLLRNSVFMRVVLVLWIVSSVFVVFLLSKIDGIVHGELYNFGLQFSFAWASPYWAIMRWIYVGLLVPSVLSGVALVFGSLNRDDRNKHVIKNVDKPVNGKVQPLRENHMVVSCSNCKRVFGKPLVMLDFSSEGKAKLVNVCPYCNHVLGRADEKSPDAVSIVDLDKKVIR